MNQLKEEQEECENKLEKERDIWAAEMFELIAEEENMVSYVINYVKQQEIYYKTALKDIERVMRRMDDLMSKYFLSIIVYHLIWSESDDFTNVPCYEKKCFHHFQLINVSKFYALSQIYFSDFQHFSENIFLYSKFSEFKLSLVPSAI